MGQAINPKAVRVTTRKPSFGMRQSWSVYHWSKFYRMAWTEQEAQEIAERLRKHLATSRYLAEQKKADAEASELSFKRLAREHAERQAQAEAEALKPERRWKAAELVPTESYAAECQTNNERLLAQLEERE